MIYAYIKLISNQGYKEAGYRLTIPSIEEYYKNKQEYQQQAIVKLCFARGWTIRDLQRLGYNEIRVFFRRVEQ